MRSLRLLGNGRSFYHCISRVVDKRKIFEGRDKEVFRKIMRNLERFMGVRVVTYCLMGNHFHLLVEVPDKGTLKPLSEDELRELLPLLHDSVAVETIEEELDRAREQGDAAWQAEILDRYERRRGSLSYFLKELKQRVTLYMNKKLDRTGTLWEGRFKSMLVEGHEMSLMTVAAYIDLNPVRAGLVKKPEDYRWSGYSEALSGTKGAKRARQGLGIILSECLHDSELQTNWQRTQDRYRQFLYEEGEARAADEQSGEGGRIGFTEEEVEAVVKAEGAMPLAAVLRHRVRYLSEGAVLGTAGFVDEIFWREKEAGRASPKRGTGARKMRGAQWGELRVMRDLRKEVIRRAEADTEAISEV
jgi:putative transposase